VRFNTTLFVLWLMNIGKHFYVQLDDSNKKIPVVSFYHPQIRGDHKLFEQRFNEMKTIAETLRGSRT